jgi:hypothetical protein
MRTFLTRVGLLGFRFACNFVFKHNAITNEPLLTNFQETNNSYLRNIARTNKLRLPIHLTNTEFRAQEHVNKLTLTNLTIYLTNKK